MLGILCGLPSEFHIPFFLSVMEPSLFCSLFCPCSFASIINKASFSKLIANLVCSRAKKCINEEEKRKKSQRRHKHSFAFSISTCTLYPLTSHSVAIEFESQPFVYLYALTWDIFAIVSHFYAAVTINAQSGNLDIN